MVFRQSWIRSIAVRWRRWIMHPCLSGSIINEPSMKKNASSYMTDSSSLIKSIHDMKIK